MGKGLGELGWDPSAVWHCLTHPVAPHIFMCRYLDCMLFPQDLKWIPQSPPFKVLLGLVRNDDGIRVCHYLLFNLISWVWSHLSLLSPLPTPSPGLNGDPLFWKWNCNLFIYLLVLGSSNYKRPYLGFSIPLTQGNMFCFVPFINHTATESIKDTFWLLETILNIMTCWWVCRMNETILSIIVMYVINRLICHSNTTTFTEEQEGTRKSKTLRKSRERLVVLGHELENRTALLPLVYFPAPAHLIQVASWWNQQRRCYYPHWTDERTESHAACQRAHWGVRVTGQESWVLVPSSCHHLALPQ